ncbi:hypothetical protein RFI_14256 [Reticulomyxa filosa]|uniref:NAD-dependent epimerase/dehydratase domain-containing protein n=1 Tax=Reticulomyxa filosa TaxID=46433 RepID=X6NC98_RETFI|nr:hypothetical protein RFI_14256 [Reticulomyxa filosa]|eukprot:ETO22937.1 hypothetical protein RFI_14256 [Reticulomyxa filosa]
MTDQIKDAVKDMAKEKVKDMAVEKGKEVKEAATSASKEIKEAIKASLLSLDPRKKTIVVVKVCESAIEENYNVISVSQQGQPPSWVNPEKSKYAWAKQVHWCYGDALNPKTFSRYFDDNQVHGVVSCVSGFKLSQSETEKICGDATINICEEAKRQGVDRFVFMSSHRPKYWITQQIFEKWLMRGYYKGKLRAEEAVKREFGDNGISLRPGFITGTHWLFGGKMPLPFQWYNFTLWWLYPSSPVHALGKAAVRFLTINDPYHEQFVENKEIRHFCYCFLNCLLIKKGRKNVFGIIVCPLCKTFSLSTKKFFLILGEKAHFYFRKCFLKRKLCNLDLHIHQLKRVSYKKQYFQ